MSIVKIDSDNVLKAHRNADKPGKQLLEDLVNGQVDFNTSITDRVKTFEDACAELGKNPTEELPYKIPMNARQEFANAAVMLDIIAEALCEGVVLNWADSNQQKWYPWFNEYTPGAGFRYYGTSYYWSDADAGGWVRLCLPTSKLAEYFGKQFLPIWNKFLNPNK